MSVQGEFQVFCIRPDTGGCATIVKIVMWLGALGLTPTEVPPYGVSPAK